VSTPGSVELDENILVNLGHNFVKVLGNGDNNRAAVIIRNGLRLEVWLQLISFQILDELLKGLNAVKANNSISKKSQYGIIKMRIFLFVSRMK
jgi:hypothetical protein